MNINEPEIKPNILVVDDIKENLFLIEFILNNLDVNLILAGSGLEALSKIKDVEIALALLDIHMPEMDGFETTKHIRTKLKKNKQNIPIIALTGASMGNEREKCFLIGMNEYIAKPFDPKKLVSIIKEVLKNEKKSTSSQ